MALKINPENGTIKTEGGGGITLTPASSTTVTIDEGILLPDGTKTAPAIRFVDDDNTGIYSPQNDTISITGHGEDIAEFEGTVSAVNKLKVKAAATGTSPILSAEGTDANIDLTLTPKGTGQIVLDGLKYPTSDGTVNQVIETDGAGNLSFVTVSGGAAGPLTDLTDVTITTPASDEVLTYNGTTWVNQATGGGGATGYHYSGTITTAPIGTGEDTLVIGEGADGSSGTDNIVIGSGAKITNINAINTVVIGKSAQSQSGHSIGRGAVVIGDEALDWYGSASGSVVIGYTADTNANDTVAIGRNARPYAPGAIAMGFNASAEGSGSIAIGTGAAVLSTASYSMTFSTNSAFAQHSHSFVFGASTESQFNGQGLILGCGGPAGKNQSSTSVLRVTTTDATVTNLYTAGTASWNAVNGNGLIELPWAPVTWFVRCDIVGKRTDVNGDVAAYTLEFCITRDIGGDDTSVRIVGTPTKTIHAESDATWDCNVSADTTNGAALITVTGAAAKTINWTGTLNITSSE